MPYLKQVKRGLMSLAEDLGVLTILQRRRLAAEHILFVLAYHRVDEPQRYPWLDPAHISASPQSFEAHMRLIASRYTPVSMSEVLAAVRGEAPLPPNAVLVTVDDAYRDFGEVAYPIARRFGIRPVLFTPTAYVGSSEFFWWDKLYQAIFWAKSSLLETEAGAFMLHSPASKRQAVRKLARYVKSQPAEKGMQLVERLYEQSEKPFAAQRSTLTWEELRSLAQDEVTIAPHTHTHPILTRVSLERARQEMRASREMILRHIGHSPPVFAYPDGQQEAFNPLVREALRRENFEIAFTMLEGHTDLARHDALQLPRIGIWRSMSVAQLHWRLTYY